MLFIAGNTKPFKCKVCDRCFTRMGSLNAHMKAFHGIQPENIPARIPKAERSVKTASRNSLESSSLLKCSQCSLRVHTKRGLSEHVLRTHHGNLMC